MNKKRETNWNIIEPDPDLQEKLSKELGISLITAQVIINRGMTEPAKARNFITPSLKQFHDPFEMKNMDIAVNRILEAIDNKEKIYIYGDYDVDGVTATSLLILFFREIGVKTSFYIPNRLKEGYGLNETAIKQIHESGGRLLITVDCGITSNSEVEVAKELGLDIIITDHHQISKEVPDALAILHPGQTTCSYPFKSLAGVGIAFKLIKSLRREMFTRGIPQEKLPNLKKYLDIVSIGTIADIAPLLDENHIIAKFGLKEITRTEKLGLKALKSVSNIYRRETTVYDVGFIIAPKINAAGRMGDASMAVDLLTTENKEEATRIAELLNNENIKRQNIQREIQNEAIAMVKNMDLDNEAAIVLGSPDWHPGVLGIVAARIAEDFFKPTILFHMDGDTGKGSARSIPSFHLYKALTKCQELLVAFGGHKYAAGLTVSKDRMEEFKQRFNALVSDSLKDLSATREVDIDMVVSLSDVDMALVKDLQKLAPFGCSNSAPVFCAKGIKLAGEPNYIGKDGAHVRVDVEGDDEILETISFNSKPLFENLPAGRDGYDVVFTPEINSFGNITKVQLRLKDIKPS